MNYLHIEKKRCRLWCVPLHNGEYYIGRDPACEIFLDHPAVSRRHAKLVCQNDRVKVIDLASGNGTFLLSRKIQEKYLAPGEAMQIAEYFLILEERKPIGKRVAQMIKSPLNLLAIAVGAIAVAVYFFPTQPEKTANRGEAFDKSIEPATAVKELSTAHKDSALRQARFLHIGNEPLAVAATVEQTPKTPKDAAATRQPKRARLTPQQVAEAERLYWRAYQIMAYGNQNAYRQALVLLRKAQQTAPDRKFSFYIKAQEKINLVTQKLTKFENFQKSLSDSLTTEK